MVNDQWLIVTQLCRILVSRHAHDLSSTAQAEDEEFWMRVNSRREARLNALAENARRGYQTWLEPGGNSRSK